jgi:hypothetical protein
MFRVLQNHQQDDIINVLIELEPNTREQYAEWKEQKERAMAEVTTLRDFFLPLSRLCVFPSSRL